ncbi:GRIP and coiled-coil domain-containing protein 1 [Culicoides brevitarsis]|uniref:GRIP and coiled-coil domain-containing protein 1 n=1 Tax=Culicoides brevitarsis TaxID=469753 RepID=UPI00307C9556
MEKEKSIRDLEALVNNQKAQLQRYETRLKDVVTAYKGLLKEKEALESSLAAVKNVQASPSREPTKDDENNKTEEPTNSDFQEQLATLMNSLATLSAEKSRQEASFQNDKKQLRQEIAIKDKVILDLQEKVKQAGNRSNSDVEALKSKLIVEKHERDVETRDHMAHIRELQKLLTDERHLKESLEMQLNDLKSQFGDQGTEDLRHLRQELEEARNVIREYENHRSGFSEDSTVMFQKLQDEMALLKQQHAVAIQNEQKRALLAEETNRKLATHHEERVASLEARLSELSCSYVRHRQQDQLSIAKLKDKLARLNVSKVEEQAKFDDSTNDIHKLLDQIIQLKKKLVIENARAENPIDLNKIFVLTHQNSHDDDDTTVPLAEYNKLKVDFVALVEENDTIKFSLDEQKVHIRTLQEKVKVLNRNIEEHETELSKKQVEFNQTLMQEKKKWKETLGMLESEYRSKVSQLENELQKQRERSISLLEEKDKEIKTLKTSFEIFIPGNPQMMSTIQDEGNSDNDSPASQLSNILNSSKFQQQNQQRGNNGPNMLHYAHELARKDVEITNLRKAKNAAETSLRQALHDKVTSQQELHDKISTLEDEVDRLKRYHSREGANLEYLKNVIVSYLVSRDPDSRKHMLNAIGAVLKFSASEMNSISTFLTTGKK